MFYLVMQNFNFDFGGDLYFDFIILQVVNIEEELEQVCCFSMYFNFVWNYIVVELMGFNGEDLDW